MFTWFGCFQNFVNIKCVYTIYNRFDFDNFKACEDCTHCPLSSHNNVHKFFVNYSKSRNLLCGKYSIYLSIISESHFVTYLGKDGVNLKIPLTIRLTLRFWQKIFPPILGNLADNAGFATAISPYFWFSLWKDRLKMTLPPDMWGWMDLEFCQIYSKLPTF